MNIFGNQRIDTYTQNFQAIPGAFVNRESLNEGGQILLPQSVLNDISTLNLVFPLQFEIRSYKSTSSHCGVLEFVADEGTVVLPQWLMEQLKLEPWDPIILTTVVLPKAEYVSLRPRQTAFTELYDPRAVLETRLTKFSTLTEGDTIRISYCDANYDLDVTTVKARRLGKVRAASIIDTEVQVEFERPADMPASPVKPPPTQETKFPTVGNVVGGMTGNTGAPAINFEPVKTYKPPSLKNAPSGGDGNQGSTLSTAPKPTNFNAFSGSGRSLRGGTAPPQPPPPPAANGQAAATSLAPLGGRSLGGPGSSSSVGVGRTLSGKPVSAPPREADGADDGAASKPSTEFKPFGGAGRTLR